MNSKHLTRRQFLGHTTTALLATAALPQLLPSHLFGAESAGHKLNVACLGMGGQMHALVNELAGLPVNVVALCDLDSKRIEALRRTLASDGKKVLADAKVYRDYRQLLEREKSADAVVIATPDHWHALLCTAAIQAGKHVYCEKPLPIPSPTRARCANCRDNRRWSPRPATKAAPRATSVAAWN